MIYTKKKKKKILLAVGRFLILHNFLVPFKLTGTVPNRFFMVSRGNIPFNLRVGVGFINKKLFGSFGVDGLGWSLGLGINGDVGKVQVQERGLDLTEAIVKFIGKEATKLLYKGVGITIFPYRILLSLMDVTLCL